RFGGMMPDLTFDKLHEECGVFAIYGHPEAANLAYLGLYALQHRGQESAGIASSDGRKIHCIRKMGHVADIFTPDALNQLPGELAIGHTRYSTTGDTEVVLHLVARSRERTLSAALRDALLQLEGAFSLVFIAEDRIIVARDPHGFRPLAMGQLELSDGRTSYVFASETCAFDLISAAYIGEVAPGEMVIVGPEGVTRERYTPAKAPAQCVFEHVYFSRPDSLVFGRSVAQSREMMGRLLAREYPVEADVVVPVPDSGVSAAIGYAAESNIPYQQALIRNHYVGRTFIEPS